MQLLRITLALLLALMLSVLFGELLSRILLFLLPCSISRIVWALDGALTSTAFLFLGQMGVVVAYGTEQKDKWIENYQLMSYIITAIIVFVSAIGFTSAIRVPNEKLFIISLSMTISIFILYAINFLKNINRKGEYNSENKNIRDDKEYYKKRIKQSLLIQTMARTQVKLGSDVNWQERQVLKLHLVWLETFMFLAENVEKSLEEKAEYFEAISEEDIEVPKMLDIDSFSHCKFSQEVAFEYGEFLSEPNAFAECDYKPESILPFPKLEIVRICKHYSACLAKDIFVSRAILMTDKQRARKVSFAVLEAETILKNDTSFIPVDSALLPVEADKNSAFGRMYNVD